ncbi:MAG: glycoside hydrolase family protein [Clostridium sp.]|nr:glycoside hydrolase family protein [Clostridium sp.]
MKNIKRFFCIIIVLITISGLVNINTYAASMSTSESGLSLIKGFEGCRLTAYKALSTETYYTIGYGHYGSDVYAGMTITQSQAEEMLRNDLKKYEGYVNTFLNKYGISVTQNQFDALVSFTYNLGNVWVSTPTFQLKTYLINGVSNYTNEQITMAFTNWRKSGGVDIPGLLTRREKEAEYFLGQGSRRIDETVDTSFQTPYECEPIADSGLITVYNVYGVAYSTNVRNIAHNDWCTIHEVYTSGYCKVTYPTSNGSHTEYAKASDFDIPKKMNINLHVWVGDTETGHCPTEYVYGNRYYICYELTDLNTGKKINEISDLNYTVTETLKKPDGSVFEYSYDNSDGNWISTVAMLDGRYEGNVSVTGDFSVDCGVSFNISHEHQYISKVVPSTFTEKGYTLHSCSICDDSYKDNYKEMKIKGDINGDFSVGVSDAVFLQKYLVKSKNISAEQFLAADINSDNKVNIFDMVILKRRILKGSLYDD